MIARVPRPDFGRCECNQCEHRCEVKQLREENARLRVKLARCVAALEKGNELAARNIAAGRS